MIISLGGIDLEISDYESDATILNQFAIKKDPDALPNYFKIKNPPPKFTPQTVTDVVDIRIDIEKIQTLDDLTSLIPTLTQIYRGMNDLSIIKLWLHMKFKDEIQDGKILLILIEPYIRPLKRIDSIVFANADEIVSIILNYAKKVEEKREKIKKDLLITRNISTQMNNIPEIPSDDSPPFILEESTISWDIAFAEGDTLPIIFNKLNVSSTIPFIHVNHEGQNWFKVYDHYIPENDWINFEPLMPGIYFKVAFKFENKYWISSGNIQKNKLNLISPKDTENLLTKLIFKNFPPDLKLSYYNKKYIGIKGVFSIGNIEFNRAIFAHMITNDPIISYFLFLKEFGITILENSKYSFRYSPGHNFNVGSETLIITLTYSSEENIGIRVSGASSIEQAKIFKGVFQKLIIIYNTNYQNIFDLYSRLIGVKSINKYTRKVKGQKDVRKTGKRLKVLQEEKPEIFLANYATDCQKVKQPYLITKDKADELARTLDEGEHKVLNFPRGSEDWYACEPRDADDNQKNYIYPSLLVNKRMKNRDKYPCVPCCGVVNQYTGEFSDEGYDSVYGVDGTASLPSFGRQGYEYVKKEKDCEKAGMAEDLKGIKNEQSFNLPTHIQKGNKITKVGNFSNLPYNLKLLVQDAGYRDIIQGRQMILPILRTGVIKSPDSFIHCMEKAFNPGYINMNIKNRKRRAIEVRTNLSKTNLAYGRQEFYDKTDREIRGILSDPTAQIDPAVFISIVSKYYNCNIFVYELGKTTPNGEILIPRHSQAYLFRDISENKESVFVVKFNDENNSTFQCEILARYSPENQSEIFSYIFVNDNLIEKATSALYETNSVYNVSPTTIEPKDHLLAIF
ncbi:hypothetical protein OAG24_00515 [bacterium]|nr:hypothetical protein [bacterium]